MRKGTSPGPRPRDIMGLLVLKSLFKSLLSSFQQKKGPIQAEKRLCPVTTLYVLVAF